MDDISRKTEIGPLDGTPEKRMFWSIISDYDLKTGLCELIDNAIDLWRIGREKKKLTIEVRLDPVRQLILVSDNAGGVRQDELRLLLAPGGSRNDPSAQIIGIFGVGGKRAGIALGEQVVIKTRYGKQDTFQIDIGKDWLSSDDWELPYYQVPSAGPGTTEIEISHLRRPLAASDETLIIKHFGESYAEFLSRGVGIFVNGIAVDPRSFHHWAYPPSFSPFEANFDVDLDGDGSVSVIITGGLIRDRDPEMENYGAYFYCNDRLIVKELKSREVGYFVTSEAGVPHPDASLCRVIVQMAGPARLMPWTSNKSGINFDHSLFLRIRPTIIQLMTHFTQLSRRLKTDWDASVFPFDNGAVEQVEPADSGIKNPLVLPPLPKVRKKQVERLKAKNKSVISKQPWTLGLIEAMGAVEIIARQKLETKNRIALILLDSNFEIALKEFIVNRTDLFPTKEFNDAKIKEIFSRRHFVIAEIKKKMSIPQHLLDSANYYYGIRNKMIHERATVGVPDADIASYRKTVQKLLARLFGIKF